MLPRVKYNKKMFIVIIEVKNKVLKILLIAKYKCTTPEIYHYHYVLLPQFFFSTGLKIPYESGKTLKKTSF